jgi:hypothetical protein
MEEGRKTKKLKVCGMKVLEIVSWEHSIFIAGKGNIVRDVEDKRN